MRTVEHRRDATDTVPTMTTAATLERRRLADLLDEVGPDAPTLCEGWDTRDLAAHIVMRDRRPDSALGIILDRFASYTERIQSKIATRDWTTLVDQLRNGPPRWSPVRLDRVDRLINTAEFFVHHEDVRRAVPDWTVRDLDDDLDDDLDTTLRRSAKMLARSSPVALELEPDHGRPRVTARAGAPVVVVRGPVGELVLWIFGRQEHARVTLDGDPADIEAVRAAGFGL